MFQLTKTIIVAAVCCLFSISSFAQVPNMYNYQAVVRNASGTPVTSQNVNMKLSITDGATPAANVLYSEERTVMTTPQGLVNVVVGSTGATATTGSLSGLGWTNGDKYMKVEIDVTGGTTFVDMGSTQLVGVPYASAANSLLATSSGGAGIVGSAAASLWLGIYENNNYRGYIGSYSGNNEDVDFGTGAGNATGAIHLTVKAVPKLSINKDGNVGIGNTNSAYRLEVDGITGSFNDNGIRIQNTTASKGWNLYASSNGDMIIGNTGNLGTFNGTTGVYTSISDERLKTNVKDIESVLTKVLGLNPKRYEFKYNNPEHIQSIGFIAQEVKSVFPEFVTINTTNEGNPKVESQLGIDYAGMCVVAIKAIQEQQQVIESLKARIAMLETK
jgi:hypothetical protein